MEQRAIGQAERDEAARWVRERGEHRERMLLLGKTLISKAEEMVRWPLATRVVTQTDADGRAVSVTLQPARWSFSDASRIVETADKLIRLSTGLPTGRHVISVEDVQRLSDAIGIGSDQVERLALAIERGDDPASIARLCRRHTHKSLRQTTLRRSYRA